MPQQCTDIVNLQKFSISFVSRFAVARVLHAWMCAYCVRRYAIDQYDDDDGGGIEERTIAACSADAVIHACDGSHKSIFIFI